MGMLSPVGLTPGPLGDIFRWLQGRAADSPNRGLFAPLVQGSQQMLEASHTLRDKAATTEAKRAAFDQMLGGMLNAGGMLAMPTVYHGTPHQFTRYDLSKIGTGEGAQAYGHGIYFAENPQVAKSYAGAGLLHDKGVRIGDRVAMSRGTASLNSTPEDYAIDALVRFDGDKASAMRWLSNNEGPTDTQAKAWIQANVKGAKAELAPVGKIMQSDLPDEVLPRLLQWDKPIAEQQLPQTEPINKTMQWAKRYAAEGRPETFNGANFYAHLRDLLGSEEAATKHLSDAGIPGLSYLDAGSRGAGSGTRNFVIWDQSLLDRMTPKPMP